MACPNHGYGGAAASRTLKTAGGTLHVCAECAAALDRAGYVLSGGLLKSENARQRCQCESGVHFHKEAKLDVLRRLELVNGVIGDEEIDRLARNYRNAVEVLNRAQSIFDDAKAALVEAVTEAEAEIAVMRAEEQ